MAISRNEWGVPEPTDYEEFVSEFTAEYPDWLESENPEMYLSESDIHRGEYTGTPIADWQSFIAMETIA